MIFKCKNCGGNVVYDPEIQKMHCPYCDGVDSEEKKTEQQSIYNCINCGGAIGNIGDFTSASRCPYCGDYIVFDERVSGAYKPNHIIPFVYSKEMTKKKLREKFKSCVFAPNDFLSEAKLSTMNGAYVPFWMYDYHVHGRYEGEGNKIRKWVSGNREYTETSVYHIVREMEVDFDKMPVDASNAMPDNIMDLMEPYNYGQMIDFKEEYMSGFWAERYNQDDMALEPRAVGKAKADAEALLRNSISGYVGLKSSLNNQVTLARTETNYALLPVWVYNYKYKGEDFIFHVNGQTGKIVGKVPLSKAKVWGYGATVFASVFTILMLVRQLLLFF